MRITGIDVSREMLEKARSRVARARLQNVDALLEMDAEQMDFPDASFDKVVAMYVVSVVERPGKLLEELHRVCKPDGEIFIVNHFQSENRIIGGIEKALSGFSSTLGFHPDFKLQEVLPAGHNGEVVDVARQPVLEDHPPAQRSETPQGVAGCKRCSGNSRVRADSNHHADHAGTHLPRRRPLRLGGNYILERCSAWSVSQTASLRAASPSRRKQSLAPQGQPLQRAGGDAHAAQPGPGGEKRAR